MSGRASGLCAALLAAGMGVLVVGAVSSSAGGRPVQRGGTLRLFYMQDPGTDPQNGGPQILTATQLMLYSFGDSSGDRRILPAAAAGFPRISRDGRTYTIRVRRGFRFSDGRPVTARNFAYAVNRLFSPELRSVWTYLFDDIVGARDVLEGKATTVSGVRVRGADLVITLETPRPDFVARLTNPTISATPLDLPIVAGGFRAPAPSAGPYFLSAHVPGRRATFVRNPFWRRDLLPRRPVHPDRIVFERAGLSQAEALDAVERNEIDVALAQGSGRESQLARRYGINSRRLFVRPRLTVHYLAFNHDRPLFRNNPKLKRAINYALDRSRLVRQIGSLQRPMDQILPPGLPGYRDWKIYPFGGPILNRARSLARGNLRNGKAIFYSLDAASVEPFQLRVAAAVKLDLAKIGLDVEVRIVPNVRRRIRTPGEPWDIAIFGWFADYPDPDNVLGELFDSRNIPSDTADGSNWARFSSAVFDRRLRRAARLSGGQRLAAYARIERDLMGEAGPVAPFYITTDVVFVSSSLGCFTYHPMGFVNLAALCKK